jgi:hypothetical protein
MSCRGTSSNPSSGPAATSSTSGTPPPCPTPCTITSQTVASSPKKRERTKIGVGEEVDLTVSPAPATWAISGSGTLSPSTGSQTTVRFTAGDAAGSVTVTATGPGCSCTVTFTVVKPASWTQKLIAGTKTHGIGRPHCHWQGTWFVHPNDVNFYRIRFRERDSKYVGTGSYSSYTGDWHGHYPLPDRASSWFRITDHTDAGGSEVAAVDTVDTGDPGAAITGAAPRFKVGSGYFPITMQWRVGDGTIRDFPATRQEDEIFANGRCESRKGGNTESTMYNDNVP